MPVWKFAGEETSQETALEDVRLELSAYWQSMEDLASWLRAHNGQEFEDLASWLQASSYSIVDLTTALSAYSQSLQDIPVALATVVRILQDVTTYLSCWGLALADWGADLRAAGYLHKNLQTHLQAVSPTVLQDCMSYLSATDGGVLDDLTMRLMAVSIAPAYQSVVAQRIASITHEV
jgi:hypothetical protein